jgi:hypothetical protein
VVDLSLPSVAQYPETDITKVLLGLAPRSEFPRLQHLELSCKYLTMTPILWQMLLDSCPKLHAVHIRDTGMNWPDKALSRDEVVRQWLPRSERKQPFTELVLPSMCVPIEVMIHFANPTMTCLRLDTYDNSWTLADAERLCDKWEGHGGRVVDLGLGLRSAQLEDTETDRVLNLLIRSFPNLRGPPWSNSGQRAVVSGETLANCYKTWCFFDSVPLSEGYSGLAVRPGQSTVVRESRVPVRSLQCTDSNGSFFESWTLDHVAGLLKSSRSWDWVRVTLHRWRTSTLDPKTADWLMNHGLSDRLTVLELGTRNIELTDACLYNLAKRCRRLVVLRFGTGEHPSHGTNAKVSFEALVDFLHRLPMNAKVSFFNGVFSRVTAQQWIHIGQQMTDRDSELKILLDRDVLVAVMQTAVADVVHVNMDYSGFWAAKEIVPSSMSAGIYTVMFKR